MDGETPRIELPTSQALRSFWSTSGSFPLLVDDPDALLVEFVMRSLLKESY